ncbi:hypothetical protein ABZ929_09345 [Streptomyces physcomitrii]|uniref:hypothetical protein n=1 Tax=Streptomyces physcomitrii TaxID=2724184 RepID=UPI0033F82F1B
MRAIRVASAALLGATALALTTPAAVAAPPRGKERFEVEVSPSTVAAGGEVKLTASGCKGRTKVHSGVFDTVVIEAGDNSATTEVDWDARKGATYSVTFSCERGITRTAELTIAEGRPEEPLVPPGEHPRHPDHGVDAGFGGTIGGLDLGELGFGALLVVGTLGTAYHFTRRRADGS